MKPPYDVAIIGSGFSGSILARILASRGRRVVLIDAAEHPRFAIGESSTPIADLLLRRLGQQYGFADLVDMSCYGSWQRALPGLTCGLKRGFSYFDHRGSRLESSVGDHSLVVAASPTNDRSDTHWYRCEVDAHLFQKAVEAGVDGKQSARVCQIQWSSDEATTLKLETGETVTARFVVDASGSAAVSAKLTGADQLTNRLQTQTCSVFAHYRSVDSFSNHFNSEHGDRRACDPFDADAAAQHHLIDDGWAWMLRFENGVTSVGVTKRLDDNHAPTNRLQNATETLGNRFAQYPALHHIMRQSEILAPKNGIVSIARLQRLYQPVIAANCLLMPATAVTIDPLHSTGIAHGLAGVERIAQLLLAGPTQESIQQYGRDVLDEAMQIDRMISMAYRSMHSFPRFTAACMVYFAAAITCEERIIAGEVPAKLWQADDQAFKTAITRCADAINNQQEDSIVTATLRSAIAPWNQAGLFESNDNRYAYTATK